MLEESPTSGQPIPCIVATSMKKKWWDIFLSDSLLRGTEDLICWPKLPVREVCCFPGTQVKDVTRKFHSLVQSSDYYLLLLCHVDTNVVIVRNPGAINRDFRALARLLKGSGVQVVFSSILPVVGNDIKRSRQTQLISTGLWGWCHQQNFGVLDHRIIYKTSGLLGLSGFTFHNWGKNFCPQVSRADWKTFGLGSKGEMDKIRLTSDKP